MTGDCLRPGEAPRSLGVRYSGSTGGACPRTTRRTATDPTAHLVWRLPASVAALLLATSPAFGHDTCTGSLLCQDADQAGALSSQTSFGAADNFQLGSDSTVTSICWTGAGVDLNELECGPNLSTFTITYYTSLFSEPGTVHAGPFTVTPVGTPTGTHVVFYDEYAWTAEHPAVVFSGGVEYWVGITNSGPCRFVWGMSPDGDNHSALGGGGSWTSLFFDFAFCLSGSCALVFSTSDAGTHPDRAANARLLATGYRLRDGVFRPSPTGRRWIELYYRHGEAMKRILREDPRLRRRLAALLAVIGSGVEGLAGETERGATKRVPPAAIALLEALMRDFEDAAPGSELARAIGVERELLGLERMSGRTYAEAWDAVNARAAAQPSQR